MAKLLFDFPDPATGAPRRVAFGAPVEVVTATRASAVPAALARVEAAVGRGQFAAGYVAYEAAPAFEPRMRVRPGNRLPLLWFGLFDGPVATGTADAAEPPAGTGAAATPPDAGGAVRLAGARADWRAETDRGGHDRAVAAVREAIADGVTYQVNLTTRLRARLPPAATRAPVRLYESLRRAQGPGWHALLELDDHVILSVSPELFFRTAGRRIETRPMKGTRPRGRWPEEDAALRADLATSEKDRAENLMIVDLLRNDLGRICATSSVRTPRLFEVERYRTVWQMTSSVEGELREGTGLGRILEALFPCGSVTGAPKISTMELIAELEPSPREVYCGAIGFATPDGRKEFNVPIRTLWWDRATGAAEYGAGGGIVWDSTAEAEYEELLAKAVVVREPWPAFRLLETLAARDGRVPRLERHLDRLRRSADYFGFPFPEDEIRSAIAAAADPGGPPRRPRRIRVTLGEDGSVRVEGAPLGRAGPGGPDPDGPAPGSPEPDLAGGRDPGGRVAPLPVALAVRPVHSGDRFLYHKTTHRAAYNERASRRPDVFDTLLHNERGEVTEFTRGNLVAELDGRRITPPQEAGLLAGCFRAELLDAGVVVEATVRVEDLRRATRLWFINSARGWLEVALAAGVATGSGAGREPDGPDRRGRAG